MASTRPLLTSLALLATAACARGPQPVDAASLATNLAPVAELAASDAQSLERGEYLVRISGCNDCHTPGYAETGGEVAKAQWLVGSSVGWNGPWGTTYPANLRLKLQEMDETAWLKYSAELHTRPPMPDFAVRTMSETDRLALYRFIHSLGPGGQPAPDYLAPGQVPQAPYVQWVLPPPPPQAQAPAAG